jgi:hypothetical protein
MAFENSLPGTACSSSDAMALWASDAWKEQVLRTKDSVGLWTILYLVGFPWVVSFNRVELILT